MQLSRILQLALEKAPESPALIAAGQTWSYAQLANHAGWLARRWLSEGLETGDRVALLLPNRPETLLGYLACFQAGLIAVPLDYGYREPQINYALRHCSAQLLIAHADRLAELDRCEAVPRDQLVVVGGADPLPLGRHFQEEQAPGSAPLPRGEFRQDDLALIFYTSGTTSRPKGVTLTRAAIAAGSAKFLARVPLRPTDVALVSGPIMRPFTLRTQILPTWQAGGTVVLLERFTPDAYLATLRQQPAKTFLALGPAALYQVVHHPNVRPEDFAAVRLCISGGDHVPAELHQDYHRLTGRELTEQCGMTETGVYALNPPFGRKKAGSIGLPMYGVQVCLVDGQGRDVPAGEIGEISVRSPLAMDGYWNDTAQTRKAMRDGAILTGDLGRFDADGYLWFMGRKKDIIVHDGWNVSPGEVEETLRQYPAVAEACVVGVTDPVHGQNVHGFVTLRPQATPPAESELIAFVAARLSGPMVPQRVQVLRDLPRTGAGKIDRDRLHWQAEAEMVEV